MRDLWDIMERYPHRGAELQARREAERTSSV
jgi:hypothetical protein